MCHIQGSSVRFPPLHTSLMKFLSLPLLSALFLSLVIGGELPFTDLMTDAEIASYAELSAIGDFSAADIYAMIKGDMVANGRVQAGCVVPYMHLLYAGEIEVYEQLVGALEADELEAYIKDLLVSEGRFTDGELPFGPQIQAQPQQVVHHAVPHQANVNNLHPGLGHQDQQQPQNLDDFLQQMGINGPAMIQNGQDGVIRIMVPQNAIQHGHDNDNGLGLSSNDPFKMSEDEFEVWLAFSEHLAIQSIQEIYAEADINNLPIERVHKIILASAEHNQLDTFKFVFQASSTILDSESKVLVEITKTGKDPRYLQAFLLNCNASTAFAVGKLMNDQNKHLHQIYVDMCGANISAEVGRSLKDAVVPKELALQWKEVDANQLVHVKTLNATGSAGKTSTTAVSYSNGDIHIAGFVCKALNFSYLESVKDLEAALSKVNSTYCLIHIDMSTSQATILRSLSLQGPAIGILHIDKDEATYLPALASFLNDSHRTTCKYTETLLPGDVIVGMSEEYIGQVPRGFTTGILDSFYWLMNLTSVENVVFDFIQVAAPKDVAQVIIAVLPPSEKKEVVEEKNKEVNINTMSVKSCIKRNESEEEVQEEPKADILPIETRFTGNAYDDYWTRVRNEQMYFEDDGPELIAFDDEDH